MSNGHVRGVSNATTLAVANGRFSGRDIQELRTANVWPSVDPYAAFVTALYPFNGSARNALGSGPDLALHTAASFSSAQVKWTGQSLLTTGASGSYALAPKAQAAFGFGTGDAVIEFWCYPTALNQVVNLVDMRIGVASQVAVVIYLNSDESVRLLVSAVDRITSTAGTWVANAWQYGCWARVSSVSRLFWGPVAATAPQVGADYADTNNYIDGGLHWGAGNNGLGLFAGHGNDLRITKASGRGISGTTVTVPTAAFNAI